MCAMNNLEAAAPVKTVAGKRMIEGLKGFASSSSLSSLSSTSDESSFFFDWDDSESTAQGSVRSILKSRSKSEARFINTDKRNWMCLPPPGMSTPFTGSAADIDTTIRGSSCSAVDMDTTTSTKSVGFGSVMVRSYQQTMGDNPAVSYGPPISLDWDYHEHADVGIDEYESQRVFCRRNLRQLAMSYYRRTAVLTREYGFTDEELSQAKREANKIQWNRSITFTMLPMMKVEDALESACRKAKRMIVRKTGKA